MISPRLAFLLLAPWMLNHTAGRASETDPDYWKAEQNIRKTAGTRGIGQIASSPAPDAVKTDPQEAMERFMVLFLAGHDEAAEAFLPRLKLHEKSLGTHNISRMAEELIRRERWDLVRRYFEVLPGAEAGWTYVFLKEWNTRTAPEEIDKWLDERAAAFPAFWSREHFRLAALQKRQAVLIEAYHRRLKADPKSHAAAMELALGYEKNADTPGIDWLADLYQPGCPSAALELAQALASSSPELALKILEKNRDLPFGEPDLAYMKKRQAQMQAKALGEIPYEKDFRGMFRREMMDLYQQTGRSAEAQKLLEQIAADFPNGLPAGLMHAAGTIQASSGARVIEERLLEAEKKPENQNTPEYWRSRGEYYQGRKEFEKALEAYRKALSMEPVPKTAEMERGKGGGGPGQQRYWTLRSITACLQQSGKNREAFDLLCEELSQWPPDHQLSRHLAHSLASDFGKEGKELLRPGDEVPWTWLAARKDWSYGGERLLRGMAESAAPEEKAAFWTRAEGLVLHDPKRGAILGWVMENQHELERAKAVLSRVLKELPGGEERESAAWTLFGLYLEQNDWQNADALWNEASRRLSYEEISKHLGTMADAAARSGYPKEAMKFWARAMNYDRWNPSTQKDLLRAGLKKDLRAYYQDLLKKEPACVVAREQLAALDR